MKIDRDEHEVAILKTTKQRMIFTLVSIITIITVTIVVATFAWLPYWIFTGKNLIVTIFES
jgi:hypothetical protein